MKTHNLILLLAATIPALAQVQYTISNLGPVGSISSGVYSIAADGTVVGTSEHSCYCGRHAYLYKGGTITDLATLGGADSTAVSVNSSGQVVGHSRLAGDTAIHAFLYSAGSMTDLGTLGGTNSFARSINDSGHIVGYSETSGARHAFLNISGTMSDLGTLGGSYAEANAINASGQIVGVSSLAGDIYVHAFSYLAGKMTDIGTLGGSNSGATAINASGQIVGYSNITGDTSVHAFLYTSGTMTDLGSLGGAFSMAKGMNDHGDVVGMTSTGAFLYTNGAMIDLNKAISPSVGWILEEATAINASGQIVGFGRTSGSTQTNAFLLDPVTQQPDAQGPLSNTTPLEPITAAAGLINYEEYEYPDFDVYTDNPTPAYETFMGDHFYRMSTFSPYFDPKLTWFPRATVYIISYGIAQADPLVQQHPEWIMHDPSGNLLYIPFNCVNNACPHYAADIVNPAFRAQWIANAQISLAHGYLGIWVDDVNFDMLVSDGNFNLIAPIDDNTGQPMTTDMWRKYFASYVEQMRYSFPDAFMEHNSIWYSNTAGDRDANPDIQRQIASADDIHVERGIGSDPGLTGGTYIWSVNTILAYLDRVHARQKSVTLQDAIIDTANQEYSAAAYFLMSAGRDATGDHTVTPDNWWPGYGTVMGMPSGPRTYSSGIFQRLFANGMVLLNDPYAATVNVQLDAVYSRPDGSLNTSVNLPGKGGALLTRMGPIKGARWLSDLNWLSATNGYGPVMRDVSTDGNIFSLNGNRFLKGLGTNADSTIHYELGACTSFTATVGVDDEGTAGYEARRTFRSW